MAKRRNEVTQSGYEGFGPQGADPVNPSDEIVRGRPLPTIAAEAQTLRRSFNEATRSPLHYNDGPGTDENVTSRRPPAAPILGNAHSDLDHNDNRPIQGVNKQPYSLGSDTAETLNGVPIYGT